MKIVLNPEGTLGDVRPLLVLGLALRKAGHNIEICAGPNFENMFTENDFIFHSVGVDMQKQLEMQAKENVGHPIRTVRNVMRQIQEGISEQFKHLTQVAAGADLLVGSGINFAGRSIADYYQIPYYLVCHVPLALKSRYHAPVSIPMQNLPNWLNLFIWWGSEVSSNKMFAKVLNENRKKLGLSEVKNVLEYSAGSTLLAADSALAPVPDDCQNFVQTAYWHLEEEQEIEEELNRFIEAGPPPIYIGFGSMTDPSPFKMSIFLQEIIDSGRFRVIISKGWAKLGVKNINTNTYLVDYVPHAKLFSKSICKPMIRKILRT